MLGSRLPVHKDTLFKTLNSKKLYTLFKTQDPENHAMSSGTYPFSPNKGVPPPREHDHDMLLTKSILRIHPIKF